MILVFVGAGGSTAVDPEQYPDTQGFFDGLPGEIQNNGLFAPVVKFLKNSLGKEKIDIEDMMAALDQFQTQYKMMKDPQTLMQWTLAGSSSVVSSSNMSNLDSMERDFVDPLNKMIKERVYKFYGKRPDPEKLSTWVAFLKELGEIDPIIEIFTTNYDRVMEKAIEQAGISVIPGLVSSSDGAKLETSFWDPRGQPPYIKHEGLLTKLHGSIDWQHDDGNIIKSGPHYTQDEQNHCILYPGYKGVPTEEPFRIFHDHLRNTVQKRPQLAIFVGFSFRDDYINSILDGIPEETFTFYFTKSEKEYPIDAPPPPPGAPRAKGYFHFQEGFTEETVFLCLHGIKSSLDKRQALEALSPREIGRLIRHSSEGKDDPRKTPWKEFTAESVEVEMDRGGVCELGGSRGEVVSINGSGKIKTLLQGLLLYPSGSKIQLYARQYRIEYTDNYIRRTEELYNDFVEKNGRPPICNDALPPEP